jgi:hypothetical protein
MEHSLFVNCWKQGLINIVVNRHAALSIANSKVLPKRYQAAHHFWCWMVFLLIPAAGATMYFFTWWAGLVIIMFIPIMAEAIKTSAMQFMIDHALENPEFYYAALVNKVIVLSPR